MASALQTLSELLYKHYCKKTILLIDEYDVPLDKAFQGGYYREMVSLILTMFGLALKTNDFLYFAVLTGCLRVSKESIFTGLNNFKVLSITDARFDSVFDTRAPEKEKESSYHTLLVGLLAGTANWLVKSNVEAGEGFADIIVETEDPNAGLILKLKYTNSFRKMEEACRQALLQIGARRYEEYLRNDGREDIRLYGISFCKKRCRVLSERVEGNSQGG